MIFDPERKYIEQITIFVCLAWMITSVVLLYGQVWFYGELGETNWLTLGTILFAPPLLFVIVWKVYCLITNEHKQDN